MRFRLATLLFAIAGVALLFGWWNKGLGGYQPGFAVGRDGGGFRFRRVQSEQEAKLCDLPFRSYLDQHHKVQEIDMATFDLVAFPWDGYGPETRLHLRLSGRLALFSKCPPLHVKGRQWLIYAIPSNARIVLAKSDILVPCADSSVVILCLLLVFHALLVRMARSCLRVAAKRER